MTRLLTLMTLLILGALAQHSPYLTHGAYNGLSWRETPYGEKTMYVNGVITGYTEAMLNFASHIEPGQCFQSLNAAVPLWIRPKNKTIADSADVVDIVKEMDRFYQDGSKISLPVDDAFKYSAMKLGGASKQELADYLDIAHRAAMRVIK